MINVLNVIIKGNQLKPANYWIKKLKLKKHPEGGYFKEMYRSEENIQKNALHDRYNSDRNIATSIYYLLKGDEFSSFHKIQSDETWHFYTGTTLELLILSDNGKLDSHLLGQNPEVGEHFQITIPRNNWFAGRVVDKNSFALLGCTVAPGFNFDDFDLGDQKIMMDKFPQHKKIIKELTLIRKY